jgi:plastocyanin
MHRSGFYLIALALTSILAASCGSSSPATVTTPTPTPAPTPAPTPSGSTSNVQIQPGASVLTTTAYSPNPTTVAVGTTVIWTNGDNTAHTTTSNGNVWNSGTLNPGSTFSFMFNTAGTFTYHCTIHPGMVGSVVVQ